MGTIQPRARGGSSLRDELKANRKDREQIRRQRVSTVKPKTAVPGSMSGIRWYGFGTEQDSGSTARRGGLINFDSSNSGHVPRPMGSGEAPSFSYTVGDSGTFYAASAGFYDFTLAASLSFGSDPGDVYLSWLSTFDNTDASGPLYIAQTWPSPGAGQLQILSSYRAYLAAGEWMSLGVAWDNLSTLAVPSAQLDIYRVG